MKDFDVAKKNDASSIKKTIRISAASVDVLRQIDGGIVNWASSVNSAVERYELLITNSMPNVKQHEEMVLNTIFKPASQPGLNIEDTINSFHATVRSALEEDREIAAVLADEGGMSVEQFLKSDVFRVFMKKVKCWSFAEKMAILHQSSAYNAKRVEV